MAWAHSHVAITVHSSGKQLVESTDAEAQILRTCLVFPTIPSVVSGQLSVVFVVRSIQKNNSSLKIKTKNAFLFGSDSPKPGPSPALGSI